MFVLLISLFYLSKKINFTKYIKEIFYFIFFSVLIPLPWFIFSYINTGNPIYPILEKNFNLSYSISPINVLNLLLFASDPINPAYLIFIPVIIFFFKKLDFKTKFLVYYFLFSLLLWLLTSSFGGSRFIIPYLPAFSLLVAVSVNLTKNNIFRSYLLLLVVVIATSSVAYRFLANYKYIPVLLGSESKSKFLSNNLKFSFGDFYDTDGYFKNNIKSSEKVLLYGFHNLYYVDFPFIDSSWVKNGDKFNYIAVQNSKLPEKFNNWQQVYYNPVTKVALYSLGGRQWVY